MGQTKNTQPELNQARIDRLQKKYASKQVNIPGLKGPGGPGGPGRGPGRGPGKGPGGPGRMPGGKPKNTSQTIGRLFGYIKGDVLKIVVALVCVIINTIATLAGSYMLRPIINGITEGKGVAVLAQGLLTMLAIYMLAVAAQYIQQRLMIGVSQKALKNLRDDLFHKVQKLPVRFYDTHNHGDIMSRFTNDVDAVGDMLNNTVISIISGVISLVGTFALMLYTNVWLTMVTVVMLPLMVFAGRMVGSFSRKFYKAQQAALGTLNGFVEETVTGQKVVKVFCHEAEALDEFTFLNDDLRRKQINASFYGGIMGPVMGNISQVSYALTACVGAVLCVLKGFDIGGLTIFVGYSRQFSRPINELSMQVNTIFSALAGAERVFDVMDSEPELADCEDPWQIKNVDGRDVYVKKSVNVDALTAEERAALKTVEGDIKVDNISFGYVPEKQVLKGVSLYAKPGQKIAFVGSTGAGKTTITNLINRFYDIDAGTITIDDIDIMEIERESLRKNIAMVLQDTHLFTGTVRENIRYGRLDATDEEVEQAAKVASAHSFIVRLEHGYDTMIEGDGANLSQGQRQLLNIARAAISKAPILILDEATSSVDTRTEKHIERGMDRLMAQRTTLVIAHRLSTVRNANAIMVLENGVVIERGDHDDLLAQKGRYYDLYTGLTELD
ncbi:MAG: ABC transporter ATP-binding protein [Lachnospiraceae bacterium]|nr:ABC transporter ATP-binding protein [Lachnospiraceae bacterium]